MNLNPTDLAAWRASRGRVGVVALPEALPGAPFVVHVDLGGLTELAGRVNNPLLEAALAEYDDVRRETAAVDALEEQDRGSRYLALQTRNMDALNRYWDAWLAAAIVEPRYIPLADLPAGGCPEDAICLHDFPIERREALVTLFQAGAQGLEPFRAWARGLGDDSDGGSVARAAEPLVPPSEPAGAVPPGPSPVSEVGSVRAGAPAGARPPAVRKLPARRAG